MEYKCSCGRKATVNIIMQSLIDNSVEMIPLCPNCIEDLQEFMDVIVLSNYINTEDNDDETDD